MIKNSLYIARLFMLKSNPKKKCYSKISEYILANIESIDRITIDTLAENTDTSYATVCRFLKEIGVCGMREFKKVITSEMENQKNLELKMENYSNVKSTGMSYSDTCKRVCDFSSSVVANCYDVLNEDTAEKIINLFSKANFIYFMGLGTSAVTALYAYTKLFRINTKCSVDTDTIISKMKASVLKKGDVLFVISSSGRTKPVTEAARIAKRNGVTVISLCDFVHSPLSDISDINICTTVRDSNKYIDMDFPLIQGQITVIDILYSYMYNKSRKSSDISFNQTSSAVNSDKIGINQ